MCIGMGLFEFILRFTGLFDSINLFSVNKFGKYSAIVFSNFLLVPIIPSFIFWWLQLHASYIFGFCFIDACLSLCYFFNVFPYALHAGQL